MLCNEALGTSSLLAVEGEAVYFNWFSRCSTIMSTEFAIFVPSMKSYITGHAMAPIKELPFT